MYHLEFTNEVARQHRVDLVREASLRKARRQQRKANEARVGRSPSPRPGRNEELLS